MIKKKPSAVLSCQILTLSKIVFYMVIFVLRLHFVSFFSCPTSSSRRIQTLYRRIENLIFHSFLRGSILFFSACSPALNFLVLDSTRQQFAIEESKDHSFDLVRLLFLGPFSIPPLRISSSVFLCVPPLDPTSGFFPIP